MINKIEKVLAPSKKAFSLAEVLITLGIIGVVATITIPTLINNQNTKVFKERKAIAELKVREITRQMNLDGMLAPHATTSSFVNALQKYVKIGEVCDSNNLTDCFAEQITKSTGEIVEIKNLKNSAQLGKTYSDFNQAFIMMDGLSFVISYDISCVAPDKYNSTLSTTECLSYILDVNGKKGPNSIGQDIILVNSSLPGGGCDGIQFGDLCVATQDTEYTCIDTGTCNFGEVPCDCHHMANLACSEIGMRAPNVTEIAHMYVNHEELGNPSTPLCPLGTCIENEESNEAFDPNEYENLPEDELKLGNLYLYIYTFPFDAGTSKIRCVK